MSRTATRWLFCLLLFSLPLLAAPPLGAAVHSDTLLSGQYESQYGGTTIWLKLCGQGSSYRFRSELLPNYTVLWDGTYGAIDGCLGFSYRAVVGAQPGSQFLLYSAVMESPLSDTEFLQRARADTCTVVSAGNVSCTRQMRTMPANYLDQPAPNQTVSGTVTVSGWAVDLAATSGTGVDEVHVYVNSGGVDHFLGAAAYGHARSDVAATYRDTRFTNAGFSFSFDSRGFGDGGATVKVAMHSTQSGQWAWLGNAVTIANGGTNAPPNPPNLLAPANGANLNSRALSMSWQDTGDPDNQPRNYRDYTAQLRKSDNSWSTTFNWQAATTWQISVPSDGTYLWRVQSGDGAAASAWSAEWSFAVSTAPAVTHTDTRFSAAVENGRTTILMNICGNGPLVRLSSELKASGETGQFLGDWLRPALANTCSPNYRPLINATVGTQVRLYSAVLGQDLSVGDFRAQARKDVCKVIGLGQIECKQGSEWYPTTSEDPPTCNSNDPVACLNLIFPMASPIVITQGYHDGYSVDFGKAGDPQNSEPVLATHSGYLYGRELSPGGAWCAWVSTKPNMDPSGYTSAYCHVTKNSIPTDKIGKWVNQGEQIALMGATGNARGFHVHYDLNHKGQKIQPLPMCGYTALIGDNSKLVYCKSMPTQARTNINSSGGLLNVYLSSGATTADQGVELGEVPADMSFQFGEGITQSTQSAEFLELFAPTQAMAAPQLGLRYFRLDLYDSTFALTASLSEPYTAVIRYSDSELEALSIDEGSLRLHYFDGTDWQDHSTCNGCTLDPVKNEVTVVLNQFGEFALVGDIQHRLFLPMLMR